MPTTPATRTATLAKPDPFSKLAGNVPGAIVNFARRLGGGNPGEDKVTKEIYVPSVKGIIDFINNTKEPIRNMEIVEPRPAIPLTYLLDKCPVDSLPEKNKNEIRSIVNKITENEKIIISSVAQESISVTIAYIAKEKNWYAFPSGGTESTYGTQPYVFYAHPWLDKAIEYIQNDGKPIPGFENNFINLVPSLKSNLQAQIKTPGTPANKLFSNIKDLNGVDNNKIVSNLLKALPNLFAVDGKTAEITANLPRGAKSTTGKRSSQVISIGYLGPKKQKKLYAWVSDSGISAPVQQGNQPPTNQTGQMILPGIQPESFNAVINKALKRFE
jgi:hypothetical protein